MTDTPKEIPAWALYLKAGGKAGIERAQAEQRAKQAAPPPPPSIEPVSDADAHRWASKALDFEIRAVATSTEGNRNHTLNAAAYNLGQIIGGGHLDEEQVRELLRDAAETSGLDHDEIGPTITSGIESGKKTPRHPKPRTRLTLIEGGHSDTADPYEQLAVNVFGATEVLTRIHTAARSRAVGPWALLGSVLARCAAEIPPHIVLPPTVGSEASLNLSVALVGPSGDGKSAAWGVARSLLPPDRAKQIGGGTGEGIIATFLEWDKDTKEHVLAAVPHAVLYADEIEQIEGMQARKGQTFGPTIRTLWSGGDIFNTNATNDRRRSLQAHTYRLAICAGVQPERSDVLLSEAHVGTPQRWLFLPTGDPDAPEEPPGWPGPLGWELPPPDRSTVDQYTGLQHVAMPDEISRYVRAQRRLRLRTNHREGMDGHLILTRLKAAAVLAYLHGRTQVTDLDWEVAGWLIDVSVLTRSSCSDALEAARAREQEARGRMDAARALAVAEVRDERVEKAAKALWRVVDRHAAGEGTGSKHEPGEGCTRRCLTYALRHFKGLSPDEAVERASSLEWIADVAGRWHRGGSVPVDDGGKE